MKAKGNKRKAEERLIELRRQYSALELSGTDALRLSFTEYLTVWLPTIKAQVSPSTYESYHTIIHKTINPYFDTMELMLCSLKPSHMETLYRDLLGKGLSPNTVLRHHAVIHKALGDAMRKELLVNNPAALAWRPSKETFITTPYSADEIQQLFNAIKGHELEVLIKLTAFYGLRRSEALGLKWKACDFGQRTISINHTIHRIHDDGATMNIARDKVKRKSSYRTLPMPGPIAEMLLHYRRQRYADGLPDPDAYLFLDKKGDIIKPGFVSQTFAKLLKENELRHIRLHDLRHSSAGVLISNRVPLIEVQQWLGHSTINTTADLYVHLEYSVKENSAAVMCGKLFREDYIYENHL